MGGGLVHVNSQKVIATCLQIKKPEGYRFKRENMYYPGLEQKMVEMSIFYYSTYSILGLELFSVSFTA